MTTSTTYIDLLQLTASPFPRMQHVVAPPNYCCLTCSHFLSYAPQVCNRPTLNHTFTTLHPITNPLIPSSNILPTLHHTNPPSHPLPTPELRSPPSTRHESSHPIGYKRANGPILACRTSTFFSHIADFARTTERRRAAPRHQCRTLGKRRIAGG